MRAVRNTIILTISNGLFAFCQWLIILVLARKGGADYVGQFTLAMAVCTPTFIFFSMGLRQQLVTDVIGQFRWKEYFQIRIISVIIGLLFLSIPICLLDYTKDVALIIFAVGLSKVVDAISELYYASYQKSGRFHLIALSRITRGFLGTAAFAACVLYFSNIAIASAAMALVWFIIWVVLDRGAKPAIEKDQNESKNIERLLALTKLSIPLAFSATFVSLKSTLPRIMLEKSSGAAELGVFSSYYYIVFILSLIVTANSQVLVGRLSHLRAANNHIKFTKRLALSLLATISIGAIGIVIAMAYGEVITLFFYGKHLPWDHRLLIYVMVMGAISYISSPIAAGLDAMRQFKKRLFIEIISTFACVVSAYFLIPRMEGEGAAVSISIGLVCQILMCAYFVSKGLKSMRVRQE